MEEKFKSDAAIVRQKAEDHLRRNPLKSGLPHSGIDNVRLIHELEVHQVELEMQNEELRLANEQVERTSKKYTELYNFSPIGYFTLSNEGLIIEVNHIGAKMLGKEHAQLIDNSFGFFVCEPFKSIFNRFLTNVFNSKTNSSCEIAVKSKNNVEIDVHLRGIVQDHGIHCMVTMDDITERKNAERILYESEQQRITVLDKASDGYVLLNHQGCFLEVNETFSQMTGYSKKELLTMRLADLELHPNEQEIAAQFQKVINQGEDRFESLHRRKDGSTYHVEVSIQYQPVKREFIAFLHNITERKQAEKALNESEFFFRQSQQAAFIGSYKADLKTGLWETSEVHDQIYGIEKSSIRDIEGWLNRIHPDDRQMLDQHLRQEVLKNGIPFNKEFRIIRKDTGEMRWVHGLGRIGFDENNCAESLVGTLQDITRRKEKEEKLRKYNKTLSALNKSSQAMSQAVDEADYLNQVCNIVVEDTDFAMVWMGFAEEDEAKTIRPVASAGFNDDYLQTIKFSWDDSEWGQGPTGTAIRTGNICMCNNIMTDSDFEPWRDQALKRGYSSAIVFPLRSGNKTFGVISIYSKETNSFLEDEIKLLSELANDLAHGITTIRLRAAHQVAEEALSKSHKELELQVKQRTRELEIANELLKKDITRRKEIEQLLKTSSRKYRLLSANISDGIFISKNGCLEYVNQAMKRIFGYTHYKMEGLMLTQLAMPEYQEELKNILSINTSLNQFRTIEIECLKKDHSTIHVEILFHYVAKEKVIYGVVHDITEKKQIQKNIVKAIILTEEKERAYFSKELHDGLGPLLSTIKLYLEWTQRPKNNKSREEIILLAEGILEEALTTVKEISNKLSPHLLTNHGLSSAIKSFVDKLEETALLKIDFESNVSRRLDHEIEAAFYRAVIECINNTVKHAGATNIYIRLNDTGSKLQLLYRDDGIGFDLEETHKLKKGLGLYNLQNRIETIGGKITMVSSPGRGLEYKIIVNL